MEEGDDQWLLTQDVLVCFSVDDSIHQNHKQTVSGFGAKQELMVRIILHFDSILIEFYSASILSELYM